MEWTEEEFKQFDRLTWQQCSSNQVTRINGRLSMRAFIDKHGKDKCDAMWAKIQEGEK